MEKLTFEQALKIVSTFPNNILLNIAAQTLVNAKNNAFDGYVSDSTTGTEIRLSTNGPTS